MRIPGVKTVKHFSRWVQARILGGALILGYHRVANVTRDDYKVCVTPKHFSEQMEMVSRNAHPISLAKLVQCLRSGSLPPRSVAVTFDDGYADTLYEAKPVLEKYTIPATVFVCTGFTGGEFWWDELDRLVMSSKATLGALRLGAGENVFVWDQPNARPEADLNVRRKFRHALYDFLLALNVQDQNHAMNRIRSWSGISSDEVASHSMDHDELRQLVDGGLIEIGAHTRHHPMLSQLSLERQREEIVSSKRELEDILGRRVYGFAYPNGMATADAKQIVREADFVFACSSEPDLIRDYRNRYQIARFWPRDWDGKEFAQWLRRWSWQ